MFERGIHGVTPSVIIPAVNFLHLLPNISHRFCWILCIFQGLFLRGYALFSNFCWTAVFLLNWMVLYTILSVLKGPSMCDLISNSSSIADLSISLDICVAIPCKICTLWTRTRHVTITVYIIGWIHGGASLLVINKWEHSKIKG